MARHGENIRKRKDGRWEGRFPVYSEEKGKTLCRSVYGKTYEEVKEKMHLQRFFLRSLSTKDNMSGSDLSMQLPKVILFSDMAEKWLIEVKETRKPSTYIKYKTAYSNYIASTFEGLTLADITGNIVQERISVALSNSMQKSVYCVVNQVLKYAIRNYCISIPKLKGPTTCMRKKPVEILTKTEQTKLFAILYQDTDIFKMAVLLCLFTGLRLGELCALKWMDIDFGNRIISVKRTVQRLYETGHSNKTVLLEMEPKSDYSKREIPLSEIAAEMLLKFYDNREYIFGKNKPLEPRTLQYRFQKIIDEAQIPHKNFHILRHTFATNCIEGGVDVKSLSELLGHSEVQITLNRYVHPSMDTKRKHMDVLSGFYIQMRGQIHGQAC